MEKQTLVSSCPEINPGLSDQDIITQFSQASDWDYFAGGQEEEEETVRSPLPVVRDTLYDYTYSDDATQFLQASDWDYLAGVQEEEEEEETVPSPLPVIRDTFHDYTHSDDATQFSQASGWDDFAGVQEEETVRSPLPVIRDTLYDYTYSDDATQFSQASGWDDFAGGQEEEETVRSPLPVIRDTLYDYTYSEDAAQFRQTSGWDDFAGGQEEETVPSPLPVIRDTLYDYTYSEDAAQFSQASGWDDFAGGQEEQEEEETVHSPLPVIGDTLYDYTYSDDDNEDVTGLWANEPSTENLNPDCNTNLATLYRPPLELMFQGSFQAAKVAAAEQDKWLLVNLQSSKEFDSHVMNRDLWSNETVAQMITSYFLFWQAQDHTVEGMKVCTFYNLDSFPVILVIDPITGQKMRLSKGMIEPEYLLMDLLPPFMENGPEYHLNVPVKSSDEAMKEEKKEVYPPLPEEPNCDSSLVCRVGVRLPNGTRFKRSFLREDPIQLLWSFCNSEIEEAKTNPFGLMVAIPGASMRLDYDTESTFEESGISNSIMSLIWE